MNPSFSPFAQEILQDAEHVVQSGEERKIREEIDRVNREFSAQELCESEHTLILEVLQEALGE